MESILDTKKDFDIQLFDSVVKVAFDVNNKDKDAAEKILIKFKEDSNNWTRVDKILKESTVINAKFIGLQIFEECIRSRWVLLNVDTKSGIREYIFNYIVENSNKCNNVVILKKFNSIFIDIIKKEWPKQNSDFITNLIETSKTTSMAVCSNTLAILESINVQTFQIKSNMTEAKRRILTNALKEQYGSIFSFIMQIFEYSETQEVDKILLTNALTCLSSFCKSMDPGYIYTGRIIEILLSHLSSSHTIHIMKCLTEILNLFEQNAETEELELRTVKIPDGLDKNLVIQKILLIHSEAYRFMKLYLEKFDQSSSLANEYKNLSNDEKEFVEVLALFLSSIYRNYSIYIPVHDLSESLHLFRKICEIKDIKLFRRIFFTWRVLIYGFYSEYPLRPSPSTSLRRSHFSSCLKTMIKMFVYFMPKPKEVFISVNELNEVVKDRKIVTDDVDFYQQMQINLYHLSFCIEKDTIEYFARNFFAISRNIDRKFDAFRINTLSWAFGALGKAFDEETEYSTFMTVTHSLLTYCSLLESVEEKAIVASNIMFIIAKYTRFFKRDPKFFAVVCFKLIEFLNNSIEGIKEMSTDTFLTLCEKAPGEMFKKVDGVYVVDALLEKLPEVRILLDFYLQRELIEAFFIAIKQAKVEGSEIVNTLLRIFVSDSYLRHFSTGFNSNTEVKEACHVIETFKLMFKYLPEIAVTNCNYVQILENYKQLSTHSLGNKALNQIVVNSILDFFKEMVNYVKDESFINYLIEVIVMRYNQENYPAILGLAISILSCSSEALYVQRSLVVTSNIIIPTLPNLSNGDGHPALSIGFLQLLISMLEEDSFFNINFPLLMNNQSFPEIFSTILNLTGCFKDISDIALNLLKIIFKQCHRVSNIRFFSLYTINTIENILGILLDKSTIQNKELQAELFLGIMVTVSDIPPISSQFQSNQTLILDHLNKLFSSSFNNVTPNYMALFYEGLFGIKKLHPFYSHIKDFMVKVHEYSNDDDLSDEKQILNERMLE